MLTKLLHLQEIKGKWKQASIKEDLFNFLHNQQHSVL